jgi:elongation of very long chain fatty acids protein 4
MSGKRRRPSSSAGDGSSSSTDENAVCELNGGPAAASPLLRVSGGKRTGLEPGAGGGRGGPRSNGRGERDDAARSSEGVIPISDLLMSWKTYASLAAFFMYSVALFVATAPSVLRRSRVVLEPADISDLSLVFPVCASVGYIVFCIFGRRWMKKPGVEPFDLKELMFVYNLFQAVFNLWFVVAMIIEVVSLGFSIWGNYFDPSSRSYFLALLIWLHYQNKYIEWLDTVFIVLRLKHKQLSGLHMYHHVSIMWAWWIVCRFMPGSDAYFGCLINSSVHVLMYLYYAIALLGYSVPWKRYITQIQLAQFFICMLQALYTLYLGNVPRFLSLCQLWVMVSLMFLFRIFYASAYPGARPSRPPASTD